MRTLAITLLLVSALSMGFSPRAAAQEAAADTPLTAVTDSMALFIARNPHALDFDILLEGTKLYVAADTADVMLSLAVAHPMLQMRLLMQDMSIFVDPAGKKRRKYEIKLPSALRFREILEKMEPDKEKARQGQQPDISPLITLFNETGAELHTPGNTPIHLGFQRFFIELDKDNRLITYYLRLPIHMFLQDKAMKDRWSVGVFSPQAAQEGAAPPPPPESMDGPAPEGGEGAQGQNASLLETLGNDICAWQKFSIDEAFNINME